MIANSIGQDSLMLKSAKRLYGNRLGATDGELGHVKDLYFDDRDWCVRYLVADTGSWIPGRLVLIPPHAIGKRIEGRAILAVNLTRAQIENSPSIATHKPVSRQFEDEYHRYYGWPTYWQGEAMVPIDLLPIPGDSVDRRPVSAAESHLRSAQAVVGYHVQASDRIIGHVSDFLIDEAGWKIRRLVVRIGHRFSGREVEISASAVDHISYTESKVFVHLTGDELEQSAPHQPVPEPEGTFAGFFS